MFLFANDNRPRLAELILAGYFAYTAALSLLLPLAPSIRLQVIGASLAALATLHYLGRFPARFVPEMLRTTLLLPGVLLAYQQIGLFAQPQSSHSLERSWVYWDRLLLADWGLTQAIDSTGPLLPGALELLYLMTYAVAPAALAILATAGRLDRSDRLLACFAASAVSAYALYPFFPSEPPRTIFPGELSSSIDTVFRQVNWWILGKAGIHTSVFPSGHVASAFGAGIGLLLALPERKVYGIAMTFVGAGIALATVYGRYHYAVDALAGLLVACLASLVCWALFRRRDRRAKA
ncbi:MAG: phosphatase PAP2 family protein [Acidobacteriia bacterium]|nr:phosphatase PAP2 family protein [Terriglobia bacterium]MYG00869.1 phosphatase PAP2 family protein [Terriglobia bacterium]MYK09056.1 phosphatase PAP2 family protein [Terriglobia bacterium]